MSTQINWVKQAEAELARLAGFGNAQDWVGLNAALNSLIHTLAQWPREHAEQAADILERTLRQVSQLQQAAISERKQMGGEIRQLRRGQKAVSAYR